MGQFGGTAFSAATKKIATERFPKSRNFLGEFVPGMDGKMRYFRPIRTEMYQSIYSQIRARWSEVFMYFCMEHPPVWNQVMKYCPINNDHLDFLFHENIAKRFPDLDLPKPQPNNYGIAQDNDL